MREKKRSRARKQQDTQANCFFCKEKKTPSFLEYDILSRFISERGKIIPRARSGACSKHQRKLTVAIKRARYIGLLHFVARPD